MSRVLTSLPALGIVVVMATPAAAQDAPAAAQDAPPQPAAARPVDRSDLRHQIYVMEGALTKAVEFGAQSLNRELRPLMGDMFLLAGDAQARGVYLDGYGIFFDVEVPMLRQSIAWSLRLQMRQDAESVKGSADLLRDLINKTAADPLSRRSLESALDQLESQATPMTGLPQLGVPVSSGQVGPTMILPRAGGQTEAAPPQGKGLGKPVPSEWMTDPNRAYTQAVQRSLIDAMLDYSPPRSLAPGEWLTVAARDNEQRDTLAPADPMQEVVTVLLRIKGSDLMEYRSGKIEKDEARKRVLVSEF